MPNRNPPSKKLGTHRSELATRKQLIDVHSLQTAGRSFRFKHIKRSSLNRCAIEEYPTENGPADYALCIGGRIVGIVEAKKLTLGPQNVLSQAERYSKGFISRISHSANLGFRFSIRPTERSSGSTISATP